MRSHLTRTVFRSLLANEPLVAKGCLRQARSTRWRTYAYTNARLSQRRHIFGLSGIGLKDRRQDYARGKGKTLITSKILGNLIAAQKQHLRPPARAEVAEVLRTFFESLSESTPLTEYDISFTHIALKYVRSHDNLEEKKGDLEFSEADLHRLLLALTAGAIRSGMLGKDAKELGDLILKELTLENIDETTELDESIVLQSDYAETYIELLAATGYGKEALRLVKSFDGSEATLKNLWVSLLKSTTETLRESELVEYTDEMIASGIRHERNTLHLMIARAANLSLSATKHLYDELKQVGFEPTYETKIAVLQFCIRNREITWGQPIFDTLDLQRGAKGRRLQYLWYAAQGQPSEQIIKALEDHLSQDDGKSVGRPTLSTINGLVRYANSIKDTASAEKYLDLIPKWGFQPNSTTYLAQFEYYLIIRNIEMAVQACQTLHDQPFVPKDLDSALEALQSEEAVTDEDAHLLNRLISVVCSAEQPNYQLAMNLLDTLLERSANLEAETIAALVGVMLPRGEYQEIHDLLESHYPIFSRDERNVSRQVVINYILDPQVDALSAWHAYDMFRNVFADTPIATREKLMKSFFARKRADLACLVFGHMRQMHDPNLRPTADLYTECFKGIADCGDAKAVELVHNMLKLDVYVNPTTRLLNSLMMAWANAGEAWRGLQIFDDILNTVEGPSYTSFAVAFRVCEKFTPNGQPFAMQFMSRIKRGGFEVTKEVYLAYIGAIAGNGDYNSVLELVENMANETGYPPDATTLGTASNSFPWINQSADFELWAQEKFPKEWEELCQIGRSEPDEETGEQEFLIDRTIAI